MAVRSCRASSGGVLCDTQLNPAGWRDRPRRSAVRGRVQLRLHRRADPGSGGRWIHGTRQPGAQRDGTRAELRERDPPGRRRDVPRAAVPGVVRGLHGQHANMQFDYQAIGSGGGIKAITEQTVDFGASDAAMKDERDRRPAGRRRRCSTSPRPSARWSSIYNVPGVDELNLDARHDRRHLPRQDHQLERPGDRGPQPGRDPARPGDHASSIARTARARPTPSRPTSTP